MWARTALFKFYIFCLATGHLLDRLKAYEETVSCDRPVHAESKKGEEDYYESGDKEGEIKSYIKRDPEGPGTAQQVRSQTRDSGTPVR